MIDKKERRGTGGTGGGGGVAFVVQFHEVIEWMLVPTRWDIARDLPIP